LFIRGYFAIYYFHIVEKTISYKLTHFSVGENADPARQVELPGLQPEASEEVQEQEAGLIDAPAAAAGHGRLVDQPQLRQQRGQRRKRQERQGVHFTKITLFLLFGARVI
jgi:hypothetical protein